MGQAGRARVDDAADAAATAAVEEKAAELAQQVVADVAKKVALYEDARLLTAPAEGPAIGSRLTRKLVAIMQQVAGIPKLGWNDFHKYHYRREEDIVNTLRPLLAALNLFIFPSVTSLAVQERKGKGDKAKYITEAAMEFVIEDGDTGEQRLCRWAGQGEDEGDKGAYKAQTGAEKFFLCKLFLIGTPETEPEGGSAEPAGARLPAAGQAQQQPAPPPDDENPLVSEEQEANLTALLSGVGLDIAKFCGKYRIGHLRDLPAALYGTAVADVETYGRKKGGRQ
jgi:hypothetical protein